MIVLGLLGPAGSGKDLVATILEEEHNFVSIAFADPMKRFLISIFGLSSHSLWGPSEERNKTIKVNDEWWRKAEAQMVRHPLDHEVLRALPVEYLDKGMQELSKWFYSLEEKYKEEISPRIILQTLGTEWGRTVYPSIWIEYAFLLIKEIENGGVYSRGRGMLRVCSRVMELNKGEITGVVIPDHRFLNEIEAAQDEGGYVIRLNRLSLNKDKSVGVVGHQSEKEMKTLTDDVFDLVMPLEEGIDKVRQSVNAIVERKAWQMKRDANNRLL